MKDKFRVLITGAEALPPLDNVVGVVTAQAAATRGDFIRAVIRARRKAIAFMKAHPEEAAAILAKLYNLDVEVAKSAVNNLTQQASPAFPIGAKGSFDLDGIKRMIRAQRSVGALTGEIDCRKSSTRASCPTISSRRNDGNRSLQQPLGILAIDLVLFRR